MSDRRVIVGLCLVAAVALALFATLRAREASTLSGRSRLVWQRWDAGFAEAKRSHRRVLVEFGAEWCRPCRMLERKTLARPRVVRALRRFVTVHVDVDREPKRGGFWVRSLPTLAVYDAEEQVVDMRPGYVTPDELVAWLARSEDEEAHPFPRPRHEKKKG